MSRRARSLLPVLALSTLTVSAFTETASVLTGEGGEHTALVPGTYCGDVRITVTSICWPLFRKVAWLVLKTVRPSMRTEPAPCHMSPKRCELTRRGRGSTRATGILLQVMEDDDPMPQMVDGVLLNTGVFHEPTTPPTKLDTWDVTVEHDSDAEATFTDATLTGDFYNGMRGGYTGPPGPGAGVEGKNMVLTFDGTRITGVLSATTTRHHVDTITSANYEQLGEVTNTVGPVVNNGVIVRLTDGSRWNVTGNSYLSSLTVDAGSTLNGTVTVNGTPTTITPGTTYTGNIVVSKRG